MATAALPGGLKQLYELPLAEVRGLALLCRRGAKTLRQDGLVLNPDVLARIEDLEQVGEAYRLHQISEGNASSSDVSASGRALQGAVGKMAPMTCNEVAILSGVSARRVRQLVAGGKLPGQVRTSGV